VCFFMNYFSSHTCKVFALCKNIQICYSYDFQFFFIGCTIILFSGRFATTFNHQYMKQ